MKDPVIFLGSFQSSWGQTPVRTHRVNPNRFRVHDRADGICVAQGAPEDTDIEIKV